MALATFERDGDVGIITIDSPPLNLVSEALADALIAATDQARGSDVRAVMVQANGDAFSAGADVEMFRDRTADTGRELLEKLIPALRGFEALPYPTVVAVNGLCLAGGFELALGCDLIWADDAAQFGLVEAVIGATPFGAGVARLAARCGVARAKEAVFSARIYPAETMKEWGVVNRILPAADLRAKTLEFAHALAAGPTIANAATKQIAGLYLDQGMEAVDAAMPAVGGRVMASEDLQNGLRSLLEKGPGQATFHNR